jgi:hypothetical protein
MNIGASKGHHVTIVGKQKLSMTTVKFTVRLMTVKRFSCNEEGGHSAYSSHAIADAAVACMRGCT